MPDLHVVADAARRPAAGARSLDAETEDEFGPWGKLYTDEGRMIGLIQYGPRAASRGRRPSRPGRRQAMRC